jgi:hypothetical protein
MHAWAEPPDKGPRRTQEDSRDLWEVAMEICKGSKPAKLNHSKDKWEPT